MAREINGGDRMRAALIGILGLAVATTAQAQQAARFDLSCEIETSVQPVDGVEVKNQRAIRMSIDTAAMQWCTHPCRPVETLAKTSPTVLTLWEGALQPGHARSFTIDRVNGAYFLLSITPSGTMTALGRCTPAAFTGLDVRTMF